MASLESQKHGSAGNPFPAVVLAGPPHCGKSVLAYQLTRALCERGLAHYLLRAVPDGEGNWFLTGGEQVRVLRARHKGGFSPRFVRQMVGMIANRRLPLLVDMGGRPIGDQWHIPGACTHSIVLYREPDELREWREKLSELGLAPLAELRSQLTGSSRLDGGIPLRGTLAGLTRDSAGSSGGAGFEMLLERVCELMTLTAEEIESGHCLTAPYPVVLERGLAAGLGIASGHAAPIWQPADLARLADLVPPGRPLSVYGRGPVWLAAFLAARALPAHCAVFDLTYGWVRAGDLRGRSSGYLQAACREMGEALLVEISLPIGLISPRQAVLPDLPETAGRGVILSGKLPRWLFAALARRLGTGAAWLAVHDPARARAVAVYSQSGALAPGTCLPVPPVDCPVTLASQ